MSIKKVLSQKPTIKIVFEIYEDDYCHWLLYKNSIGKYIKDGEPVPTGLLKKFLSYKVTKDTSNIHKLIDKYTDETIEYFSKQSLARHGYNFSLKKTEPYNTENKFHLSSEILSDNYVFVQ
jgi:hypothetical protein